MKKTRVLVVDDSALIRRLLSEIVNAQPDMEVVAAVADPIAARERIRELNPDVLTLDIEMPRMDGIDFLEKLMRLRPMPVVMISTLTEEGAGVTLRALELGAVDFVGKPRVGIDDGMQESAAEIVEKIRVAARARIGRRSPPAAARRIPRPVSGPAPRAGRLVVIGASTGGTEAIREVLSGLPSSSPPVMITQHMPPVFTRNFAQRLNQLSELEVKEAEDGEPVIAGHAYVAPGGRHLVVEKSGAGFVTSLLDTEPVNRHKPSVDVLFRSVARHAGENAIGVLLTGMGRDGAQGMLEMKRMGAFNIAQNEATCVVFGMPGEAIKLGAVDEVMPVGRIAARLIDRLSEDESESVAT